MRILLIGKDGQVGWELQRALAPLGHVSAMGRAEMDLERIDEVRHAVRTDAPDIIVNAASYTAVDRAESEAQRARTVNVQAPEALAQEAKRLDALFIHYSTDYVFDGAAKQPYTEAQAPAPLNIYGSSKWEGERAIQASGAQALILRSSWIYGTRGKNFLLTMQGLMHSRQHVSVVDDQRGAPTWSRLIADATAAIVNRLRVRELRDRQFQQASSHIYHLTCAGTTTWYGFAGAIAESLRRSDPQAPLAEVRPITTAEYPTPARRPAYSVLSNAKIGRDFGIELPDWRHGLSLCLGS